MDFLNAPPAVAIGPFASTIRCDPLTHYDLNGLWWRSLWRTVKRHRVGIASFSAGVACGIWSAGLAGGACAVLAGAAVGALAKYAGNRHAGRGAYYRAAVAGGTGNGPAGWAVGAWGRRGLWVAAKRFFRGPGRHRAAHHWWWR